MNLFNYLMAKKGHNTSVRGDLFSYLLGKGIKEPKIVSGTTINITDVTKEKIGSLKLDKESTQSGTPTPDNPVEVETVKGYENLAYTGWAEDFVSRINDTTKANIETFDGKNCLMYTANAGYQEQDTKYFFKINWKENTQYRIKFNLFSISGVYNLAIEYTDGTTSIFGSNPPTNVWTSADAVTKANKTVKYIRVVWSAGKNYIDLDTFMVYEGAEEKPYVPYGSNYVYTKVTNETDTNYYTIPLNNNEIAGIDNYKDELIVDKNGHCWLNKKIKKLVLNGTETWNVHLTREHCFYIAINTISLTGLSDHYIKILPSDLDNTTGIYLTYTNRIIISDLRFSTTEDFKQWLTTNNVIVYYVLQEPELIDLNYTVDIRLFKGNSEITNSDNMNMILEYY